MKLSIQVTRGNLRYLFLVLAVSAAFTSCKKDPKENPAPTPSTDQYVVQVDARDSAYLKTKDIYLWNDLLPSIFEFKPRNSADIYAVMTKVRTFQPLDRFSFVERKAGAAQASQGLDTDFGFLVKFRDASDLRVNYVYPNSPAGKAGVRRGWQILSINGRSISGSNQSDINYLNDVFFGSPQSATFEFRTHTGGTTSLTLNKGTFQLTTVLYRNIYNINGRKVGYFVFNEFSGATSVNELVNTMNYFQSNGVNEMVVDLRYNRGGFVSTQDTLANMLAPRSVGRGQKVMYQYVFNQKYSSWNDYTYFNKPANSTLDLSRIVFIVTPASASASELLINNLRPVMNVKLVGQERTYGKPVGFFPIPVFEYNIYPVSFKTVNSVGSADYYSGFPVDKNTLDDLTKDFGDPEEASLKEALRYASTGGFSATAPPRIMSTSGITEGQLSNMNKRIYDNVPKIEIEHRKHKMPKPIRDLQK